MELKSYETEAATLQAKQQINTLLMKKAIEIVEEGSERLLASVDYTQLDPNVGKNISVVL